MVIPNTSPHIRDPSSHSGVSAFGSRIRLPASGRKASLSC